MINYFISGFSFLNKNFKLFIISAIFIPISALISYFLGSPLMSLGSTVLIISLIAGVIGFSYYFSIPLFAQKIVQKESLSIIFLLKTAINNSKRLVFPIILLGIIVGILFVVGLIILIAVFDIKNPNEFTRILLSPGLNPIRLIFLIAFTAISSLLIFTPIFFSIENQDIFDSWIKSISYSIKNMNFIVFVALFQTASSLLTNIIEAFISGQILSILVISVIATYISLGVLISSYFYYRDQQLKTI